MRQYLVGNDFLSVVDIYVIKNGIVMPIMEYIMCTIISN